MANLQTLITLRESPIKLKTTQDLNSLPGKIGTLLSNIVAYLNVMGDNEKKDWWRQYSTTPRITT